MKKRGSWSKKERKQKKKGEKGGQRTLIQGEEKIKILQKGPKLDQEAEDEDFRWREKIEKRCGENEGF